MNKFKCVQYVKINKIKKDCNACREKDPATSKSIGHERGEGDGVYRRIGVIRVMDDSLDYE